MLILVRPIYTSTLYYVYIIIPPCSFVHAWLRFLCAVIYVHCASGIVCFVRSVRSPHVYSWCGPIRWLRINRFAWSIRLSRVQIVSYDNNGHTSWQHWVFSRILQKYNLIIYLRVNLWCTIFNCNCICTNYFKISFWQELFLVAGYAWDTCNVFVQCTFAGVHICWSEYISRGRYIMTALMNCHLFLV